LIDLKTDIAVHKIINPIIKNNFWTETSKKTFLVLKKNHTEHINTNIDVIKNLGARSESMVESIFITGKTIKRNTGNISC
jgi:hypothetical protein